MVNLENEIIPEPLTLTGVKALLERGRWTTGLIFPHFRKALYEALKPSHPEIDSETPFCYLSIAFYRQSAALIPSNLAAKEVFARVGVIDSDIKNESQFWDAAVKTVVGREATLELATESEINHVSSEVAKLVHFIPELGTVFQSTRYIVVFDGTHWVGSTQPHFAGCLFIRKALLSSPELAENLIHEMAHQELFGLNLVDRIVAPEADHKEVFAPFQGRPRPTIGRLHAAHALYRTCQFHQVSNSPKLESDLNCLKETVATFDPGDLTEFGHFLVDTYDSSLFPEKLEVADVQRS